MLCLLCKGQCYDEASNMAGSRAVVATKTEKMEVRALHIHCMAYPLNLVVQDTCRSSVAVISDALDTAL